MTHDLNIGVCIRAKDEQNIICDWILHYLKLGFDKIIIYDNLSVPSIRETLNDKNLNDSKIEIINDIADYSNQENIYKDCIQKNKNLDWILFCDTDEFLYVDKGNIKEFLNTFSDDTCTVLINWLVFGTNNLKIYDKSKTIYEQFTKRENYNHFWNQFVKSFIRPKLIDTDDLLNNSISVHKIYNKNYKLKNIYNEDCTVSKLHDCDNVDKKLSDKTSVLLVHYMTLDFESMLNKRIKNAKQNLGFTLKDNKYTKEWYQSSFSDNNLDLRMMKYKSC